MTDLPVAGSASAELAKLVQETWSEAALKTGIELAGFDPDSPLGERLAWAHHRGLLSGGILSRFSTKLQQSTTAQVCDCVAYGAGHGIYVPPEFVCVDEAVSGRKVHRDGLNRIRFILEQKLINVLLFFKVSRLFRVAYKGFQFFQEEVVEEGLRAISITQGIDTSDEKTWKQLAYFHGIMDELLLGTIADHVRSGIASLFRAGYVTGAVPVGFRRKEVAGPATKLGRPRTVPEVDPVAAELIRQHVDWILNGMPLREGWRRWMTAGGPFDPRSTSGHMSYPSYRRMLSNPRLTGRFAFGRKRNVWKSKKDRVAQIDGAETDVIFVQSEELRIVGDPQFAELQKLLAELKLGPRGPKRRKEPQLWDLLTDCFLCEACSSQKPIRFYQAGGRGHGMSCKRADLCSCLTVVQRKEAVLAVCQRLDELLQRDGDLLEQTIASAVQLDSAGDERISLDLKRLENKIAAISRKINDLADVAGEGSDEDRALLKAKVRAAQLERLTEEAERARLQSALSMEARTITPEEVRILLGNLTQLLIDGAAGKLGGDLVHRAADVFRKLVGGRIWVRVERRAGRKRTNVRGVFTPVLLPTVQAELGDNRSVETEALETWVWLRQPPKRDRLADRVYQLIEHNPARRTSSTQTPGTCARR
ncbi:MAG: recombinase family protein [Pirellulales bacterium]